jgi:hypothetical protein
VAAASGGDRGVVAVARGTDNAAYVNTMPFGGTPTGWRSLGGAITSNPDITLAIDGSFIRFSARGTDNALYLNTRFVNTDWQGYEFLGGALA